MTVAMFYDFETSGLPAYSDPSEAPHQPHIVQAAAKLINVSTRRVIASIDLIAKPEGWEIPDDVAAIHGIDTAFALVHGVSETLIVEALHQMWQRAQFRVGHNQSFDARIMRIGMKRFDYSEEANELWKSGESQCTGLLAKPIMQMPPKGRFGYKMPKLSEAYLHFTGMELEDAHSAMADVDACIAVYFGIQDLQAAA